MTQHLAVGAEADRADRRGAAFGAGGNDARSAADVQRRDLRRAQAHASAWNVARAAGPERRAERNPGEVAVLHEHRIALRVRRVHRHVAASSASMLPKTASYCTVLHRFPSLAVRVALRDLRSHRAAEVHCTAIRRSPYTADAPRLDLDALHQRLGCLQVDVPRIGGMKRRQFTRCVRRRGRADSR